jgi:hypothetical protein
MQFTNSKKFPTYLILVFYVLFSLLPVWSAGNIVLCYSAKGHLEFEVKTAQACSGSNSMRDIEQCDNARPCFCVDIPVSKNKTENTICITKGFLKNNSIRYNHIHTPQAAQTTSYNNLAALFTLPVINCSSHVPFRTTVLLI